MYFDILLILNIPNYVSKIEYFLQHFVSHSKYKLFIYWSLYEEFHLPVINRHSPLFDKISFANNLTVFFNLRSTRSE